MTLAKTLVIVAASATLAHAQSAPAEALFREGRELIKQGKLEAGCDKLAASEKLESSVGTLLNLGDCKEKLGQTATAWAAFRKAEALAKRAVNDTKRQAEAKRRADKLETALPNLVVQMSSPAPGLVIKRDGDTLDAAVLDTPVPIDPGPHTIVAEAPGYKRFETQVTITRGGRRFVTIPTLERVPVPAAPPPAAPPPVVVTARPAAPVHAPLVVETPPPRYVIVHDTWSGTRKAAVAVGVVGAAAIGAGIYFGLHAKDLASQSDALCPGEVCNDVVGLRLNDDAQTNATRANILLIGGGAAVAAATVMWFVGAPEERTVIAPSVTRDSIGASFAGRF